MIRLSTLRIRRYRSFLEEAELRLRPLTLLYGRNNAGKSTLLRVLSILSDSVAEDAISPWDLRGPAARDATFLDVLPAGSAAKKSFYLSLGWTRSDAEPVMDEFEIYYDDDRARPRVAGLRSIGKDGEILVSASSQPYPDDGKFDVEVAGRAIGTIELSFTGLVPDGCSIAPLDEVGRRLRTLRRSVQWLESVRSRPARQANLPGGLVSQLKPTGENAVEALLADRELRGRVAAWYRRPPMCRELEAVVLRHPLHALTLSPRGGVRGINLADTGEGMGQVLPVLVAAELLRVKGSSGILAVEEPESHLHADAERELAKYLWELAASDEPPIVVAETHSRTLLLAIQVEAAKSNPALARRVGIWWIGQDEQGASSILPVELQSNGGLGGWPRVAMTDDIVLARELQDLQLRGYVAGGA